MIRAFVYEHADILVLAALPVAVFVILELPLAWSLGWVGAVMFGAALAGVRGRR